jgi:outer membrane protein assembly factor BamA
MPPAPAPSFADLEAAGAVIGEVRVVPLNIFDAGDPRESNVLFRAANRLHIRTRPQIIERELLFKPGERVSVRLIEETERNLRSYRHLYHVEIRPIAYRDGVVDIEVLTRDTWSFDPGLSFSRAGGANSGRIALKEYNLLGTGIAVGVSRASTPERKGNEFSISNNHLFGSRAAFNLGVALDDRGGRSQSVSLVRPFHALDARWAAGASGSRTDRVDPVYERGEEVAQYRVQHKAAEAFRGWSRGLVDGWTQRYSLGVSYDNERYEVVSGQPAPGQLPEDLTLTGPFFRYEVIQDDYRKLVNRDSVESTEFFALGLQARAQFGRAMDAFGSTRNLWQYSASLSNGFEPRKDHILSLSATMSGRYAAVHGERELYGAALRYYAPQRDRALFFALASVDLVKHPDATTVLQLGGDNGLRGYPLRYQTGDRRVLLSVEERAYTDWYPFRLFRVGGAVFYDVGRAWSGERAVTASERWLSDVGFGLRFVSARSAFGNVLHADVAFPLNARDEVRSVQFLLKTKATF